MVSEKEQPGQKVDAEAAAWLARLNGPFRSARSEAGLRRWLERDPAHEAAFERATEIWEMIPGAAPEQVDVAEVGAPPVSRRRMMAVAAGVAAMITVGGGYALLSRPPAYETAVGGQELVRLDDGSRVSLNTDSRIAIFYSEGERRVRLDRGEAMFEVAHAPERPFLVEAGNERIRALGTTFVVRRDAAGKTSVTLVEGRVEVARQAGAARIAVLSPGQRVTVSTSAGAALDRPPIELVTAWRRGEVVFEDASLIEVAEELNRYSPNRLVVDPGVAGLRVSGVFSTSDPGEAARAIAALHRLRVEQAGEELRLSSL
jgi:transmembrane sensor